MSIIGSRSNVLGRLLQDNIVQQVKGKTRKRDQKIVIDFNGQVMYQAFKKLVEFCYLDDLNILLTINDSSEMIEVIKLANQFNLTSMIKATENFFLNNMVQLIDSNSTFLSIKTSPNLSSTSINYNTANGSKKKGNSPGTGITDPSGNGGRSQQASRGNGAPQQLP